MSDNILLVLRKTLGEERVALSQSLLAGFCEDYAEYRHNTGILKGLAIAERELTDLNDRIETE